jgi:type IV pilus assembly protein PilW
MNARLMRRGAGFSLVELMVALVIGLLALLFATRLVLTGEQNKQASLGGSDAMQNGMVALFSITRDATQAGYGLSDTTVLGCDTDFTDTSGFELAAVSRSGVTIHPLAPAVIESNGANPDRISLYSGSSITGTGSLGVGSYSGSGTINVDDFPFGFAKDDVVLAAPEVAAVGRKCALSQITRDVVDATFPAQQSVSIDGAGRYTNGALSTVTFSAPASKGRLFNLGPAAALSFHTWSVENGFLRLRASDLDGASVRPSTVIDNVVSLKAQYGFDMRPGVNFNPTNGMQVGRWSSTMINADTSGITGDHLDYQRIAALRVAVVARSKSPEKPDSEGKCSATTDLPKVFTSSSPEGVAAVPIEVDVAVAGDPIPWQCYRYRVFETIVSLRNAGMRQPPPGAL